MAYTGVDITPAARTYTQRVRARTQPVVHVCLHTLGAAASSTLLVSLVFVHRSACVCGCERASSGRAHHVLDTCADTQT